MLHQASCVAIDGRAMLIEGPSGAGKTTLALTLIDRGARLVGDDGVTLERRGELLIASPPPNISGMIEVRNVGIAHMPGTEAAVALILRLDEAAPRFIEVAERIDLLGLSVPWLAFAARDPAAAIRAELALQQHGLPLSP